MKKYKIKTPNKNFAGKQRGVRFSHGEAIAELTELVKNEFVSWGYEVEEIIEEALKPKKNTKKTEK